ncbi:restriction endonuclease subunit S [Bifidobacterium adolescentis]|uniref:restriction endonuclease subunit S n=1 Tax=Bifidobacterium adolescentis TaxID=1680 RepID=UPI00232DE0AA|nr:restriction endonuclease subunit S [Bifidobacterium adolescentis]MDB1447025.1 restriction endonuclease subunit S [Bifidobacterium adolescentis]MDB1449105.1 restriction endonuclease subunit S [Bifidobacterium adolescentis]MDB1454478.1 restriction endonuclease subunit S [Bifidobacterium adolescentis]MDB1456888.1 restriction endonuclease subunit S [Bifidobacterium adolescentis]
MAEQHGKALVPQIRFAGFTDPWEQRKLGELFEESDERASDREILSVSVANGIYPASESDRETNPGASLANYKIVHFGDVVYNSMRMWQGAVDASRYDGIVSPAYVVTRPNSEVYARFFARLLRQPMLLKQYQQVSQGNSKDTQVLKFDDFASIGISMPASENEQRQIGAFFDRLDSLITLHQRKYDKLCVLKKSMLDKMFPKGGSLYPEIRFAGFTDPWEQRKLGELFEESDERASDREILSVSVANGIYPASESDRETNPGASLANYKIVHFGDVVYNSMRMWQGAVDASRYDGIVSPAYVVTRPNSEVYARFFARLLRQPMLLKQYQQVSQGNSKDTQVLKFDDFASIGISMPASENEQRQIGAFFDRLDSLITLHQRKLELLRNIKKSMLDKMFV